MEITSKQREKIRNQLVAVCHGFNAWMYEQGIFGEDINEYELTEMIVAVLENGGDKNAMD